MENTGLEMTDLMSVTLLKYIATKSFQQPYTVKISDVIRPT